MVINIWGLSFFQGLELILSPCILPILPLILAIGLQGGKLRPYGILVGFIASFTFFSFFTHQLFDLPYFDPYILKQVSASIILLFGIVLHSDFLCERLSTTAQGFFSTRQPYPTYTYDRQNVGFWSGFPLGILIGIIWIPYTGPVISASLIQSLKQTDVPQAIITLSLFSFGAILPILLLTLLGQKLVQPTHKLLQDTSRIRKELAFIIIISALSIQFDIWQKISGAASTQSPEHTNTEEKLESMALIGGLSTPYPAPKIEGIDKWINSKPLTLSELQQQGKVVLIDFWTYSCINCVRTLPHLKKWHEKYHDKGLVIIGVHAPEFDFEKNQTNVETAIQTDGLKYPVAMDNNFITWHNFKNSAWPAHYLINKDGKVVYTHFGEGHYDTMENNIRYLLGMGKSTEMKPEDDLASVGRLDQSPETYLGMRRTEGFSSPESPHPNEPTIFSFPTTLSVNHWALAGKWSMFPDRIVSQEANASLRYHFRAKFVYLVLSPSDPKKPISIRLLLNGKPIGRSGGKAVKDDKVMIEKSSLYELVHLESFDSGILEIQADAPGLNAYAFTFGS